MFYLYMKRKNRKSLLWIIFVVLWIIPIWIQSYREIYKPIITKTVDDSIVRAYNPTTSDLIIKRCWFICLLLAPVWIILIIMWEKENNKKKK